MKALYRLEAMRKEASEWNAKYPNSSYGDWRKHVKGKNINPVLKKGEFMRGETLKLPVIYSHSYPKANFAFDHIGTAYDTCRKEGSRRVDNTGWYLDEFCGETIIANVCKARIKQSNGKKEIVYFPAYNFSDTDECGIWITEGCDNAIDAASRADHLCEVYAEREREYREIDSRENQAVEKISECKQLIKDARLQFNRMKKDFLLSGDLEGSICETVKEKMQSLRDTVRENVSELVKAREALQEAKQDIARYNKMYRIA